MTLLEVMWVLLSGGRLTWLRLYPVRWDLPLLLLLLLLDLPPKLGLVPTVLVFDILLCQHHRLLYGSLILYCLVYCILLYVLQGVTLVKEQMVAKKSLLLMTRILVIYGKFNLQSERRVL